MKITGTIVSYSCARMYRNLVSKGNDKSSMGAIAIEEALADQSDAALSTASGATGIEEEADYVQFMLGYTLVKGWVWRSLFGNGDDVEVVMPDRCFAVRPANLRPMRYANVLRLHLSLGAPNGLAPVFSCCDW